MTAFAKITNVETVQVSDIQQAYDVVAASLANDNVDAALIEGKAIAMIGDVLTASGYKMADKTQTLIKSHVAKINRGKAAPIAAEAASARALDIVAAAGVTVAAQPKPANTDAANTDADPAGAAVGAQAITPAERDAAATQAGAAPGMTGVFANAARFATLSVGAAELASIDTMITSATSSRVRSFAELQSALQAAIVAAQAADEANAVIARKTALVDAGDHDAAALVELPKLDAFRASGLANIKAEGPFAGVLDTLLATGAKEAGLTYAEVTEALAKTEEAVLKAGQEFRNAVRGLRAKTPRASVKGGGAATGAGASPQALSHELPEYEIVMQPASTIFTDAFGHTTPILDFEVPVITWAEPHPDVPEVDPTFKFYGEVLADLLDCIAEGTIPWLYGESGCGKSEIYQQIAARLGFPFYRLNMDTGITRSDIIGRTMLMPNESGTPITVFVEGILPRALRTPSILMIDEFDCGDPEIMPVLQPVLEGRGLRILEEGGRLVEPHEWSRIGVTGNTNGLGSANNMYLNVQEQSGATRNRMAKFLKMPYLPADKEVDVVLGRIPHADPAFVTQLVQLANKIRDGYRMGEMYHICSTRNVLEGARAYAKFLPLMNGDEASTREWVLRTTITNGANDQDAAIIKGSIDNIWP